VQTKVVSSDIIAKGVDLIGLLGDIKEDWGSGGRKSPAGSRGGAPVGGLVPQKLKLFVKLHIIFSLKYNKQQLLLLLDKINLA